MNYEEYEARCEEIRAENAELLKIFQEDIKGLSEKTVRKHLSNVSFYINEYLLREDAKTFDAGTICIGEFLGYYFIRKCAWSTPASIKSTAASIKKFYKCMLEHRYIEKSAYNELCDDIKQGMEGWIEDCERYNDPEYDYFGELAELGFDDDFDDDIII